VQGSGERQQTWELQPEEFVLVESDPEGFVPVELEMGFVLVESEKRERVEEIVEGAPLRFRQTTECSCCTCKWCMTADTLSSWCRDMAR